jgi:hypothetical protein
MQPPSPRKPSHGTASIVPYSPKSPDANKETHQENVSETSLIHSPYELDSDSNSTANMSDIIFSIANRMRKEEQDYLALKEKHVGLLAFLYANIDVGVYCF